MTPRKPKIKKEDLRTPKGTRDILPEDVSYWEFVETKAKELVEYYGFMPIRTPHIEKAEIFSATLGEETDIVEKQMYSFRTRGGDQLVLRPEGTASAMRAYFQNGMQSWPQPVALYYSGSFFRHENPQHGRFREFGQFGVEVLNDDSASADAIIIRLFSLVLEDLGFKSYTININTLGDKDERSEYRKDLVVYYKKKTNYLCKDCKRRLKTNPFRLLDCKEEDCIQLRKEAPQIINYITGDSKKHFREVLEFLDELGVPYTLDPYLVRGLDYYSRTVFEVFVDVEEGKKQKPDESENKTENDDDADSPDSNDGENGDEKPADQKKEDDIKPEDMMGLAVGGGGRYDYLSESLGQKTVPACGWAMGIDRIVELMKKNDLGPRRKKPTKVFLIQIGLLAKQKSMVLLEMFRKSGLSVKQSFAKDNLRAQLKIADKLGAESALIIGQKEALDETAIVRDMESGVQETVPVSKIMDHLKKKKKK